MGNCDCGLLAVEGEGARAGTGAGAVVVVLSGAKWARSCDMRKLARWARA